MIPYIREVRVSNYKSLARVATTSSPFTLLVGPNGAGKSNFIDCLAFVQECLSGSVEDAVQDPRRIHALTWGGGLRDLDAAFKAGTLGKALDRDLGLPPFAVSLAIDFGDGTLAEYAFEIAETINDPVAVGWEQCEIRERARRQELV